MLESEDPKLPKIYSCKIILHANIFFVQELNFFASFLQDIHFFRNVAKLLLMKDVLQGMNFCRGLGEIGVNLGLCDIEALHFGEVGVAELFLVEPLLAILGSVHAVAPLAQVLARSAVGAGPDHRVPEGEVANCGRWTGDIVQIHLVLRRLKSSQIYSHFSVNFNHNLTSKSLLQ